MWSTERDLDCISNVQFSVQSIPQPHDFAHRMQTLLWKEKLPNMLLNESKHFLPFFLGSVL